LTDKKTKVIFENSVTHCPEPRVPNQTKTNA